MKPQYTLKDFDLLVAKVKHLRIKQQELKKEEETVVDALTDLLVDNNLDELTTTQGFKVYQGVVFDQPLRDFYSPETMEKVRGWCIENDIATINTVKLKSAIQAGEGPPFPTPEFKPRAAFKPVSNIHAKPIDIERETERAYMTAKKDRLPHMQLLRDAGLSFQKIADIYRMSKTQVRRDLAKKQTVKQKSIYSTDL